MESGLFQETQLGALKLKNKFVVAPLGRCRADPENGIPNDLMMEYYTQRSQFGLIITEASHICRLHKDCFPFSALGGIYNEAQAEGWRKIVNSVHKKGGLIMLQISHQGRAITTSQEAKGQQPIGPSPLRIESESEGEEYAIPHELTIPEIQGIVENFRSSAILAKQAGFDGIELHAANGYLVDSFLRDGSNKRTDKYGGSIENRSRFCLEVLEALISVFGSNRVAVRFSPTGRVLDMYDSNPLELMRYILGKLSKLNLAFVELKRHSKTEKVFSKVEGHTDPTQQLPNFFEQLRPFYQGNLITNDSISLEEAHILTNSSTAQAVSFGHLSMSNPDLPYRVQHNKEINRTVDRATWLTGGAKGYTDYPFSEVTKS